MVNCKLGNEMCSVEQKTKTPITKEESYLF